VSTGLITALLQNARYDITVASPVAKLRKAAQQRLQPGALQRPACEAAWEAAIAPLQLVEEDWKKLWTAVHPYFALPGTVKEQGMRPGPAFFARRVKLKQRSTCLANALRQQQDGRW
jgi:hypothetical protein